MKELLFPTTVHYYDNVLEPEYVDSMSEFIEKQGEVKTKFNEGWQSTPDIHNHVKFKALTEKIMIFLLSNTPIKCTQINCVDISIFITLFTYILLQYLCLLSIHQFD